MASIIRKTIAGATGCLDFMAAILHMDVVLSCLPDNQWFELHRARKKEAAFVWQPPLVRISFWAYGYATKTALSLEYSHPYSCASCPVCGNEVFFEHVKTSVYISSGFVYWEYSQNPAPIFI
jgi:hypothetical protein